MKVLDFRMQAPQKAVALLQAKNTLDEDTLDTVKTVIQTVRTGGDEALLAYTRFFDCSLELPLAIAPTEIEASEAQVSERLKGIMQKAKRQIEAYHRHQQVSPWRYEPEAGILMGQRICPIGRVGLYIPGGKAAYPSTLLMNAIPAQIAGVKEIAVFTPRDAQGQVSPLVLYAAKLLGLKEVYAIGGAQAVAAAAYGTKTIPKVDKLVGPGNRYVTAAKKLVFGDIAIDMIAGPSEVLIVADDRAKVDWLAADLLAQGEHDGDARLYVCTTDQHLPLKLATALENQLATLPKANTAREALQSLQVVLCDSIEAAIDISNEIAPEHLELMVAEPLTYLDRVSAAGSVFLGDYCPEALGDYLAGPNHTLPTSGTARFSSPLGVYDFIKRPSYLFYDQAACLSAADEVWDFALAEALEAHGRAIQIRKE